MNIKYFLLIGSILFATVLNAQVEESQKIDSKKDNTTEQTLGQNKTAINEAKLQKMMDQKVLIQEGTSSKEPQKMMTRLAKKDKNALLSREEMIRLKESREKLPLENQETKKD